MDLDDLAVDRLVAVADLDVVELELADWNEGALRAYERAGFRRIGVRRAAIITRGERGDEIFMDAVPEDRPASL